MGKKWLVILAATFFSFPICAFRAAGLPAVGLTACGKEYL